VIFKYEVYCHTSPSGKHYVGYTKLGMMRRFRKHVCDAKYENDTWPFRNAIRKYGADAFTHKVLERCVFEFTAKRAERKWILALRTLVPFGYNATTGGEGPNHGEESRAKLSVAGRGRKYSALTRLRMSAAARNMSAESRANPVAACRARDHGHTAEAKARIGAASKARFAAVSDAFSAYRNSEANTERLREYNANRVVSGETRRRQSEAQRKAWAEGRRSR
jgi:group I intron endonuclease